MTTDKNELLSGDNGVIKTPFNIEEILRSCPDLLKKWEEHPFFLDVGENGRVVVVYL